MTPPKPGIKGGAFVRVKRMRLPASKATSIVAGWERIKRRYVVRYQAKRERDPQRANCSACVARATNRQSGVTRLRRERNRRRTLWSLSAPAPPAPADPPPLSRTNFRGAGDRKALVCGSHPRGSALLEVPLLGRHLFEEIPPWIGHTGGIPAGEATPVGPTEGPPAGRA